MNGKNRSLRCPAEHCFRPCTKQRFGTFQHGCAGGDNIINQQHPFTADFLLVCLINAQHIDPPLFCGKLMLHPVFPHFPEQRTAGTAGFSPDSPGNQLRLVIASFLFSLGRNGNPADHICILPFFRQSQQQLVRQNPGVFLFAAEFQPQHQLFGFSRIRASRHAQQGVTFIPVSQFSIDGLRSRVPGALRAETPSAFCQLSAEDTVCRENQRQQSFPFGNPLFHG